MQPLTSKELDYIADSLNNEDLLIKRCATVASQAQSQVVKNLCNQLVQQHMQNYTQIQNMLQQHSNLAPTQPQ
ncbi:hypothetical protein [Alicyclobacillus ferrooxydans]|uniref:Spore coat protein n=1 Tax=Alicyclobacillus ferrooxydans TaxID=471514 RepID=A0A0P9CCS3_9BACL|nr:hypothetical protein [Alicyclobacillus ferrooxydans]KPV43362.1 hypothetical protein AN477_13045 [Alicyclobacillus ferrooxydans]